jgi:hypothetical protein
MAGDASLITDVLVTDCGNSSIVLIPVGVNGSMRHAPTTSRTMDTPVSHPRLSVAASMDMMRLARNEGLLARSASSVASPAGTSALLARPRLCPPPPIVLTPLPVALIEFSTTGTPRAPPTRATLFFAMLLVGPTIGWTRDAMMDLPTTAAEPAVIGWALKAMVRAVTRARMVRLRGTSRSTRRVG